MKLGYIILYVPDVAAALAFYEAAFGLTRRFLHESGEYGELETGATALAFASETVASSHGFAFTRQRPERDAAAVEVAFVVPDPTAAYQRAVEAGAAGVSPPAVKPWGQTVAYVRDPNGFAVELCTEITG
jgi:uncharacterized glyoxalase superfamily protein PhnB